MQTLAVRLVTDAESEGEGREFYSSVLSPLLEHVEADVYLDDVRAADDEERAERSGGCELDHGTMAGGRSR